MELMVKDEEQEPTASLRKLFDPLSLRPYILECLQAAQGHLEDMFPDKSEELVVTMLVSWPPHTHPDNGLPIDIVAHFQVYKYAYIYICKERERERILHRIFKETFLKRSFG